MMSRRPEHALTVVQVALALNVVGQPAVFLIGERCADSCGCSVTDPVCALTADELVMLRKFPKACRPEAEECDIGHQRPVFALDLIPKLRGYTSRSDWACV